MLRAATRRAAVVRAIMTCALAVGCAKSDDAGSSDTSPARDDRPAQAETAEVAQRRIDSTNQEYRAAILAKNPERMTGFYDPDAVVLSAAMPAVKGTQAIRGMMAGIASMTIDSLDYRPESFVASGDIAVQTATYRVATRRAANAPVQVETGTSLVVWRRQPSGDWRILRELQSAAPGIPAHTHD